MTDQNTQFFAILTAIGEAKLANATALGTSLTLSQMGVGDANGTDPIPSRTQTKLINERRRAPLNQVKVDPANASVIIAEQIIPEIAGGWWVRELALYDAEGDMVAVANCAPTYKSLLAQGSGRTQVIRINLVVSSTANVELKIDPSVVLATRDYVDLSIAAVLPPNKAPGTYRQVTINKYGIVQSGANPTTLAGNGITDAQPLNANLTALAGQAANGFYVKNGLGTAIARAIAVGNGISVTNGDGVAGNPTLVNTGVLSLAGTVNQVSVSGPSGNITLSLPQAIHAAATPSFAQLNLAADPSAALHAATKQYVDNLLSGLDVKTSVLVATTANIARTGTQTIDGVAVTVGSRVLIKSQTTASQNGIYVCAAGTWTRASDADTWKKLVSAFVFVERGTQNGDTGWVCTSDQGGVLDTSPIVVSQYAGAGTVTAGPGIAVTGNQVALAPSGVLPGTYPKVTFDAFGRITGAEPLAESDIPFTVGITGAAKRLAGFALGTTPSATFTADEILVKNASDIYRTLRSVAVSVSVGAAGLGGIDTGSAAANTWYSVWIISNGSAIYGLLSLSETAPVMPAGYTFKARVGWILTDGSVNKFPLGFIQAGNRVQYRIAAGTNLTRYTKLASGTTGGNLTAVSVSSAVPVTASSIRILTGSSYGETNLAFVAANPSGVIIDNALGGGMTYTNNNTAIVMPAEVILESRNLYWSSNGVAAFFSVTGWVDNL